MDKPKFVFGEVVGRACRVVALDWHSRLLTDGIDDNELPEVARSPGLYAFEGCHDASPSGAILYIGQSGHRNARSLSKRLPESLGRVWRRCSDGKMRLHSDVWDVTVRWATILDQGLIAPVERLLIAAHSPSFNKQHTRENAKREDHDLLVLNAGKKGRLMPVVFGAYLTDEGWPDSTS